MPFDRFHDLGSHHGPGALHWAIFALLLVTVLLLALTVLDRLLGQAGARRHPAATGPGLDESLAALRLRYARGEIDRDHFIQASRDLGLPPPPDDGPTAVQPPPA